MQGGDTLIKDLAKLLSTNIRGADDALFRYKLGDEFLILCFGATGLVASERVAERLSQLIKEHNFYISTTSEARHITVSMGVTEVQIDDSFDLITRRLQQALWKAKNRKGSIHLI
jgi:diguanylate cyclase (GGDEF)-like protein